MSQRVLLLRWRSDLLMNWLVQSLHPPTNHSQVSRTTTVRMIGSDCHMHCKQTYLEPRIGGSRLGGGQKIGLVDDTFGVRPRALHLCRFFSQPLLLLLNLDGPRMDGQRINGWMADWMDGCMDG